MLLWHQREKALLKWLWVILFYQGSFIMVHPTWDDYTNILCLLFFMYCGLRKLCGTGR